MLRGSTARNPPERRFISAGRMNRERIRAISGLCTHARSPVVAAVWVNLSPMGGASGPVGHPSGLVRRPELYRHLGLPRDIRRALTTAARGTVGASVARIIRFDFHYTTEGWRISEANVDVPGGLNEASGFPALVAPHYPWAMPVGDPARAYADALVASVGSGATVALVHATAYSDDRQMMAFVANHLCAAGVTPLLASPAHLHWEDGQAIVEMGNVRTPVQAIVRFFPGEWLPPLPRACGWPFLIGGGIPPVSNPATAVLVRHPSVP